MCTSDRATMSFWRKVMKPHCCLHSSLITSRLRDGVSLSPPPFFLSYAISADVWSWLETVFLRLCVCTATPKPWPDWTWAGNTGKHKPPGLALVRGQRGLGLSHLLSVIFTSSLFPPAGDPQSLSVRLTAPVINSIAFRCRYFCLPQLRHSTKGWGLNSYCCTCRLTV